MGSIPVKFDELAQEADSTFRRSVHLLPQTQRCDAAGGVSHLRVVARPLWPPPAGQGGLAGRPECSADTEPPARSHRLLASAVASDAAD